MSLEKDNQAIISLKEKFLEGDLIQMYTFIWEKVLSKGEEEEDFEVQLIENSGQTFELEKLNINETKKIE